MSVELGSSIGKAVGVNVWLTVGVGVNVWLTLGVGVGVNVWLAVGVAGALKAGAVAGRSDRAEAARPMSSTAANTAETITTATARR